MLNLLITMLLGGLWHGAGLTFVFWGFLHGVYLVINHGFSKLCKRAGFTFQTKAWFVSLVARPLTLICVFVGWVFFRADSFDVAVNILNGMVGGNGVAMPVHYQEKFGIAGQWLASQGVLFDFTPNFQGMMHVAHTLFLLTVALFAPNSIQLMQKFDPVVDPVRFSEKRQWGLSLKPQVAVFFGIIAAVSIFGLSKAQEFLYFKF